MAMKLTSRSLDFIRPERREKLFALAVFFVLTGLVSLFGEFFMDSALIAEADLLAADGGMEIALSLGQPPPWLAPGLLFTAFTLPIVYVENSDAPAPARGIRSWIPSPSDKVPI